ncbi:MAG: hypothetical protein HY809_02160 [Nitrospirae bacterium]|nr:hypothetical protein [Nitrospirota bacterium]
MLKISGRAVPVSKAIAGFVLILIGIVSIMLTRNILHNTYKIENETEHIVFIDNIHSDTYRLILAMHHFLISPEEKYSKEATELIRNIKAKIRKYRENEKSENYEKKNVEVDLLDIIIDDMDKLEEISNFFNEYSKTGRYDKEILMRLEDFAYELEDSTTKINNVHVAKIKEWSEESLKITWAILFLYVVFIIFGGFPFIWDTNLFSGRDR